MLDSPSLVNNLARSPPYAPDAEDLVSLEVVVVLGVVEKEKCAGLAAPELPAVDAVVERF